MPSWLTARNTSGGHAGSAVGRGFSGSSVPTYPTRDVQACAAPSCLPSGAPPGQPTTRPASTHPLRPTPWCLRRLSGRRVTFEYTLLAGVNDSAANAQQLGALLRRHDLRSHVNVIPWNPVDESGAPPGGGLVGGRGRGAGIPERVGQRGIPPPRPSTHTAPACVVLREVRGARATAAARVPRPAWPGRLSAVICLCALLQSSSGPAGGQCRHLWRPWRRRACR